MENAAVTESLCKERRSKFDERCARDIKDIESQALRLKTLEEMSITMGQILKNMDQKTEQHERRISALEGRPLSILNKWETAVIGSLVGLVLSFIFSLLL
jgi:hypothetical protein